jgi:thiol-disulfide isomerase/thioredoxin
MATRLLILLLVAGAALLAWRIAASAPLRRRRADDLGLPGYRPGLPGILYFTTPGCAPCETIQKPALERVDDLFEGKIQILEFDATVHPQLADAWGVLAAPTTFLIDPDGRPRRVNHGPVRFEELLAQLARIGVSPSRLQSEVPVLAHRGEGNRHGPSYPRL